MDRRHSRASAWTRRGFLGLTTGATLGAYGWSLGLAANVPSAFDGRHFQLRAFEPTPKRGGVLRYGVLSAPAHFDVHQSGTAANVCTQGCMYDNLIRRDPRDSGQSIIPDLAHSWEVSADKQTYTFLLRQGVKFHDGGAFTAEDVKATYQRIIWPPAGVSIPRTPLFAAVSEINVRDPYVIEFKLSEARPEKFMLGAFASGWNIIVRKKTLEENNYNLRQVMNYPGTGPFRHVKRVDKEVWVMERNPDYWNEGLPYLDGMEIYHLAPFTPELGGALLSGKIDYARALDPVTGKKVWTYRTKDDGPTAAVVADGYVAFNTESCELEVVTAAKGQSVWKKWLGDPLMSMPAAPRPEPTDAGGCGARRRADDGWWFFISLFRICHAC